MIVSGLKEGAEEAFRKEKRSEVRVKLATMLERLSEFEKRVCKFRKSGVRGKLVSFFEALSKAIDDEEDTKIAKDLESLRTIVEESCTVLALTHAYLTSFVNISSTLKHAYLSRSLDKSKERHTKYLPPY